MDSITSKADHADTSTGHTTPAPSPMKAKDYQPDPITPLPRLKRVLGQSKAAGLKSQQWKIKNIVDKRRTRRE